MRKLNYVSLIVIFLFGGCASGRTMNDADCLRKINTLIANELDKNHVDYDLIKEDIKIIMKFYIQENGRVDSIVVLKSNLYEKGIDESLVISNLEKKRYKCLREVYYGQKPEPDYITIIFNPKLSK
ncbi:MAG: hypothetical protein GXY66_09625 [Bacteroidales bacterium]|nr:hypothetical protein [Bacteroidales bacterium]